MLIISRIVFTTGRNVDVLKIEHYGFLFMNSTLLNYLKCGLILNSFVVYSHSVLVNVLWFIYIYKINDVLVTRTFFTSINSLLVSRVRCSDLWTRKIWKNENCPQTKNFQHYSVNWQYFIQLWLIEMTLSLKYSCVSFFKVLHK